MLRCTACGRIIPAAENKFKFPAEVGSAHYCNACGIEHIKTLEGKGEAASDGE